MPYSSRRSRTRAIQAAEEQRVELIAEVRRELGEQVVGDLPDVVVLAEVAGYFPPGDTASARIYVRGRLSGEVNSEEERDELCMAAIEQAHGTLQERRDRRFHAQLEQVERDIQAELRAASQRDEKLEPSGP